MAFYGYREDLDRCYSTPYGTSGDYDYGASSQHYEFGEPELIEYDSSSYYRDYSVATPLELNYSIYTYSEPKVIQYDPIEYHSSYNYYESSVNPSELNYIDPKFLQYDSETKFRISYSKNVESSDYDFEEYDPTPYDGGYDPVETYGKPLPPSDATCYPRTVPRSDDSISLENFQYSSIPSPYGKDNDVSTKPPNVSKPVETKTETETNVESGDKVCSDGLEKVHSPSHDQDGPKNGYGGDDGYEREKLVPQIQYGSGLEALDICETIFGHWPCLAKMEEQQRRNACRSCDHERKIDPWETAANYLFGSPVVYDHENYHHQNQPYYNHDQNSWLQ